MFLFFEKKFFLFDGVYSSILQDENFSEKKNFEKKFGRKISKKKFRKRVGVWRWVCGGGRGSLDGETGVQDGRFDRCNVARRPFVPLQTV